MYITSNVVADNQLTPTSRRIKLRRIQVPSSSVGQPLFFSLCANLTYVCFKTRVVDCMRKNKEKRNTKNVDCIQLSASAISMNMFVFVVAQ